MKLPEAHLAIIDPGKIRDYLLSREHPVGRYKARFFASVGYSSADSDRLVRDLRAIVASGDATAGQPSVYGQKYEVRGMLVGPSGGAAQVVTVWIVLTNENVPRFVTAFPG